MTKLLQDTEKLCANADASLNKTSQTKQALAQLEATLLRKENQKVTEKSLQTLNCLYQEVSNL